MSETTICLKQYINEDDYRKLEELRNICTEKEDIYLKLELEFKLNISQLHREDPFEYINEFFYYSGEALLGYLGIFSFGGKTAELTGMVHPLYRRKGIFKRLYNLAKEECKRRNFKRILLVCDNRGTSGLDFIKSVKSVYGFSEYEMKLRSNYVSEEGKNITLRKASNADVDEISRQSRIYFASSDTVIFPEDDEKRNIITYMIELDSKVIGKIKVDAGTNEGFISGFGIMPEYRGKGYGREALITALYILNEKNIHCAALEVAAQNKNALNLYKSCGFIEESVMDYFEDK